MKAELFVNQNEVNLLINAVENLARVNRLTGLWDHLRGDEAAKGINGASLEILINSEIQSRKNVELRARFRKEIDQLVKTIVEGN